MDLVKLNIKGITYSEAKSGAYALILEEEIGNKTIPIIIGGYEAQSIAIALEKDAVTARPLTHDLFINFIEKLEAKINYVKIYKFQEGIFYSVIVFENNSKVYELDSRTSDAIAIGLRDNAPIYTSKAIVKAAGIDMNLSENNDFEEEEEGDDYNEEIEETLTDILKTENESEEIHLEFENVYDSYSVEDLQQMLDIAVHNEDYEEASEINKEIEKRKKNL